MHIPESLDGWSAFKAKLKLDGTEAMGNKVNDSSFWMIKFDAKKVVDVKVESVDFSNKY